MLTAFADIQKLALAAGKVPNEIPMHYWHYCRAVHRREKGLTLSTFQWFELLPPVITLGSGVTS